MITINLYHVFLPEAMFCLVTKLLVIEVNPEADEINPEETVVDREVDNTNPDG